jgi:hypothetical protein
VFHNCHSAGPLVLHICHLVGPLVLHISHEPRGELSEEARGDHEAGGETGVGGGGTAGKRRRRSAK